MPDREFSLAQSAFAILTEATGLLHPDPNIVRKLHPSTRQGFTHYGPEGEEIYLAWLDSPEDNQPLIKRLNEFLGTIIDAHSRMFGVSEGQKPVIISRYGWEDGTIRSWQEVTYHLHIPTTAVRQFDVTALRRMSVYGKIGDFIPPGYPRRKYWER